MNIVPRLFKEVKTCAVLPSNEERAYPRYVRIMNIIQERLNFKFIEKLHDRDQYINICIIYLCNCIYLISLFPKILRYFLKIIAFFKLYEKVSRSDA